jgi:hypothetical protein
MIKKNFFIMLFVVFPIFISYSNIAQAFEIQKFRFYNDLDFMVHIPKEDDLMI